MAVKVQVEVFCIVMPCSVVVGYHYTMSQPRRPRLEIAFHCSIINVRQLEI
jgi:hypothetical protein